jgi:hypothetical protein
MVWVGTARELPIMQGPPGAAEKKPKIGARMLGRAIDAGLRLW